MQHVALMPRKSGPLVHASVQYCLSTWGSQQQCWAAYYDVLLHVLHAVDLQLPPSHESYIEIAIALSTGLYGGIHLSQWSSHFPSPAEAELWRWSSVFVAGSGFFASLAMIAQKITTLMQAHPH